MTARSWPARQLTAYAPGDDEGTDEMGQHGKKVDCSACNGTGSQQIGNNGTTSTVNCVACNGTGKV